ncbi:MAG: hypothetical protein ACYTAO_11340 [Planctomycetota bacterium]
MLGIEKINDDPRPIESAWSDAPDEVGATVGHQGVTAITPYEEFGEMAPVTWLAVYRGDELWKRLNCAHMAEIAYASGSK